jgi:hypothetical protein
MEQKMMTMKQIAEQLVTDWQGQGVALETMAQDFNLGAEDAQWASEQIGHKLDWHEMTVLAGECVKVAQARLDD